jgi:hypothetical protein
MGVLAHREAVGGLWDEFENTAGLTSFESIRHPTHDDREVVTHCDRDPYHYAPSKLEWLAQKAGLKAQYIGDWNHPRHQMMMVFTH